MPQFRITCAASVHNLRVKKDAIVRVTKTRPFLSFFGGASSSKFCFTSVLIKSELVEDKFCLDPMYLN